MPPPASPPLPATSLWPLRTVVINLDRRKDRWDDVVKRLAALQQSGKLVVERLPALDGAALGGSGIPNAVVLRRWTTDRNARFDGRPGYRPGVELEMSPGERGCSMSHVEAWRLLANAEDESGPVLILEDDVVIKPAFAKRLPTLVAAADRAGGCDALYLGYIQGSPWRRKVAPGLHEAEYLWTTVAYLLWPRGARKLLGALPVDCPVDNFMAWQCASGRLLVFAAAPELADQEAEWDVGSDVPHSDDVVLDL